MLFWYLIFTILCSFQDTYSMLKRLTRPATTKTRIVNHIDPRLLTTRATGTAVDTAALRAMQLAEKQLATEEATTQQRALQKTLTHARQQLPQQLTIAPEVQKNLARTQQQAYKPPIATSVKPIEGLPLEPAIDPRNVFKSDAVQDIWKRAEKSTKLPVTAKQVQAPSDISPATSRSPFPLTTATQFGKTQLFTPVGTSTALFGHMQMAPEAISNLAKLATEREAAQAIEQAKLTKTEAATRSKMKEEFLKQQQEFQRLIDTGKQEAIKRTTQREAQELAEQQAAQEKAKREAFALKRQQLAKIEHPQFKKNELARRTPVGKKSTKLIDTPSTSPEAIEQAIQKATKAAQQEIPSVSAQSEKTTTEFKQLPAQKTQTIRSQTQPSITAPKDITAPARKAPGVIQTALTIPQQTAPTLTSRPEATTTALTIIPEPISQSPQLRTEGLRRQELSKSKQLARETSEIAQQKEAESFRQKQDESFKIKQQEAEALQQELTRAQEKAAKLPARSILPSSGMFRRTPTRLQQVQPTRIQPHDISSSKEGLSLPSAAEEQIAQQQIFLREQKAARELAKRTEAASKIQRLARNRAARKELSQLRQEQVKQEAQKLAQRQNQAAKNIQKIIRGRAARQQVQARRQSFEQQKDALQRALKQVRINAARKAQKELRLAKNKATEEEYLEKYETRSKQFKTRHQARKDLKGKEDLPRFKQAKQQSKQNAQRQKEALKKREAKKQNLLKKNQEKLEKANQQRKEIKSNQQKRFDHAAEKRKEILQRAQEIKKQIKREDSAARKIQKLRQVVSARKELAKRRETQAIAKDIKSETLQKFFKQDPNIGQNMYQVRQAIDTITKNEPLQKLLSQTEFKNVKFLMHRTSTALQDILSKPNMNTTELHDIMKQMTSDLQTIQTDLATIKPSQSWLSGWSLWGSKQPDPKTLMDNLSKQAQTLQTTIAPIMSSTDLAVQAQQQTAQETLAEQTKAAIILQKLERSRAARQELARLRQAQKEQATLAQRLPKLTQPQPPAPISSELITIPEITGLSTTAQPETMSKQQALQTLGITKVDPTKKDIRTAYFGKALELHPDALAKLKLPTHLLQQKENEFKILGQAFERLIKPQKTAGPTMLLEGKPTASTPTTTTTQKPVQQHLLLRKAPTSLSKPGQPTQTSAKALPAPEKIKVQELRAAKPTPRPKAPVAFEQTQLEPVVPRSIQQILSPAQLKTFKNIIYHVAADFTPTKPPTPQQVATATNTTLEKAVEHSDVMSNIDPQDLPQPSATIQNKIHEEIVNNPQFRITQKQLAISSVSLAALIGGIVALALTT